MASIPRFPNPYRPGAGHMPTYLAGRQHEEAEFRRILAQTTIFENLILTGLRGVGKTVLLETLKPVAISEGWLWVGTDLSESASLSEERLAIRLLADLAVVTSNLVIAKESVRKIGFGSAKTRDVKLNYDMLLSVFHKTPGLVSDKLKVVLQLAWSTVSLQGAKGIIFAYDEAQNLDDHSARNEFPLSLLLDVFQSIQKRDMLLMLTLAGLPTLFPKLVESRTFSERMFHVTTLESLSTGASRDAILKPIADAKCPVRFTDSTIESIIEASGGYPYFLQFFCKEAFDAYLQNGTVPQVSEITRKLDSDFFMGRWSKATDRQRALLWVVAHLDSCNAEFTLQQVAAKSADLLESPFSPSHISQMFGKLSDAGLIFKNRHGKYSFAVPLLGGFIIRQNYGSESF